MDKIELKELILSELERYEKMLQDKGWDLEPSGRFKCRCCSKVRGDHLRSLRRGICKKCEGEK